MKRDFLHRIGKAREGGRSARLRSSGGWLRRCAGLVLAGALGMTASAALAAENGAGKEGAEGSGATNRPARQRDKAAEESKPASDSRDFSAFKLVYERNIFDPTRRPNRSGPSEPPRRAPRVDSFTLRGTFLSDNQLVAIFDGSDSAYQTSLGPSKSIAGFRVVEVDYNGVKLSRSNQVYDLPVLGQMRRQEGGDWTLSKASAVASMAEVDRSASRMESPASEAGLDEVTRRMMARRRQEEGKEPVDAPPPSTVEAAREDAVAVGEPGGEPAEPAPAAEPPPSGDSDTDALIKRLMEKRAKE